MMISLVKVAVLMCLPYVITASCFGSHAYYTENDEAFCIYDFNMPNIEVLLPGEFYDDESICMNCTCSTYGLDCCGYGINAGVYNIGPECTMKMLDNCHFTLVKTDNEDEEC